MAQWLWRLQSDTLGLSLTVARFPLFSFLPEQVEFRLNFHIIFIILHTCVDFTLIPMNCHTIKWETFVRFTI